MVRRDAVWTGSEQEESRGDSPMQWIQGLKIIFIYLF